MTTRRRGRDRSWTPFLLGCLAGLLFRSGKLGKGLLLAAVIYGAVLFGNLRLWWDGLAPAWHAVIVVAALALFLVLLDRRFGLRTVGRELRVPAADRAANERPRTLLPAVWVYMVWEWRDEAEDLLPLDVGRLRGRRHLVYVGKTTSFDRRMEQHRADKRWWHDDLEFTLPGQFWTETDALAFEADTIRRLCHASALYDRPRENREHNDTYDPARCARLLRKTSRELTAA